jgi:putative FmdB family regulatory protein
VPVYEYRCRSCSATREEIQPMGAGPPGPCELCGGELGRIYGRVGVRFSGWGFRRTDSLLPEGRRGEDFALLQEKADELRET